jgi:hypothetical protein
MWHEGFTVGAALKILGASIIAFICSTAIAMAVGYYVPRVYGSSSPNRPDPGRVYTLAELQKAEKEAKARVEELRRQVRAKSFAEVVHEQKLHALWAVWVPWLLVPFVVRLKSLMHFAALMLVPIAATFLNVVPIEELLVITTAIAIGISIRQLLASRRHAT